MRQLRRDAAVAARVAQLRYVESDEPGIRRVRRGAGFAYYKPNGQRVSEAGTLRRIASLVIPPAWQNVWICQKVNGHLQATGYDARGRKQYRYHPRWRKIRDLAKYEEITTFAEKLPKLREQLERDLSKPRLTKEKVAATVVSIMDATSLRVGNDKYATANGSYGLTTLRDRHAKVTTGRVEFRFRGKGGKPYRASVCDRRLAAIVRRCREIPGQRLFQYVDDAGRFRPLTSTDVNEYIQRSMGQPFTAKEFRTWAATLTAIVLLHEYGPCRSVTSARRKITQAIDEVAARLGNTRTICKSCYVHPAVVYAYESGDLCETFAACFAVARARAGLGREESAVIAWFSQWGDPLGREALGAAA